MDPSRLILCFYLHFQQFKLCCILKTEPDVIGPDAVTVFFSHLRQRLLVAAANLRPTRRPQRG